MSAISGAAAQSGASSLLASASTATKGRPSDGDTPAQEAAESSTTKVAEAQNGGFAPSQGHAINKLA